MVCIPHLFFLLKGIIFYSLLIYKQKNYIELFPQTGWLSWWLIHDEMNISFWHAFLDYEVIVRTNKDLLFVKCNSGYARGRQTLSVLFFFFYFLLSCYLIYSQYLIQIIKTLSNLPGQFYLWYNTYKFYETNTGSIKSVWPYWCLRWKRNIANMIIYIKIVY